MDEGWVFGGLREPAEKESDWTASRAVFAAVLARLM